MKLEGLIDGHFHFKFDGDLEKQHQMLAEAFNNGMTRVLEAATSSSDFSQRLALKIRYPQLFITAGAHPAALEESDFDDILLEAQIKSNEIIAVGEIGLDYSYDIDRLTQQNLFASQLSLAKQQQLPVMLHIRDAHDDALAMLKEQNITDGVVHCFTGDISMAKKWLDHNFYLSFSGIVTFKNATALQHSATYAPINQILCETDSPYLAPTPHRGEENQVAYVSYVYDAVAKLKNITKNALAQQVTQNFNRLYHI